MTKVKAKRFLQLLGIMLLCSACVSCYSEWEGLRELKKLCAKDAGLKIYKTVEAEGYYDTTGGFDFVTSPYKFYEFCNDPSSFTKFDVIPEPGCYRVEKIRRTEKECHQGYDKALFRYGRTGFAEFREKNCIAVKKIDKPEARYSYILERKEWWINERTRTKMTWGSGKIINTETGEVLGEGVNYVFYPKWYGTGRSKPSIHCGSYQITGKDRSMPFAEGLIEKTLIVRTDNKKGEQK